MTERTERNHRRTGAIYEQLAAEYLEQKGYRVLERNYYTRAGEIDLIARDGRYLVFVEVKYRKNDGEGHPLEAVDSRKQGRIRRAAQAYLYVHHLPQDTPCRFDVVGILGETVLHVEDGFS